MGEPASLLALVGFSVAGLALASAAFLRAWSQWLELKRLELGRGARQPKPAAPEISEIRERVRRLEAIASGEA
jgi:hypothetical protein